MRTARALAFGFVAAAAVAAACSSSYDTTTSDQLPGGPDGGALDAPLEGPRYVGPTTCGDLQAADATCGACSQSKCCAEGQACASSPACSALVQCLEACTLAAARGAECAHGCQAHHADGVAPLLALDGCTKQGCATECPAELTGGLARVRLTPPEGACAEASSCSFPECRDCNQSPTDACETDVKTSATSCGACGNACAPGLSCVGGACVGDGGAGAPVVLTTDALGASRLVAGGGWVYFDGSDGLGNATLRRVPASGGPVELVATMQGYVVPSIVTDATYVYWAAGTGISRRPHAGGASETLWAEPDGGGNIVIGLALSSGTLFTIHTLTFNPTQQDELVSLVPGSGSTTQLSVDGSSVTFQGPLVADSTAVWLSALPGGLRRWDLGAATPSPTTGVFGGVGPVTGLAVDATDLYFGDGYFSSVNRMPKAGGAVTAVVQTTPNAGRFAIDAQTVLYATAAGSGQTIVRVPKQGGTPAQVATATIVAELTVDAGTLFYLDADGGGGERLVSVGLP